MTIKNKDKIIATELMSKFKTSITTIPTKIEESIVTFDELLKSNKELEQYIKDLYLSNKDYFYKYVDYLYYRFLSAFEEVVIKTLKTLRDEGIKIDMKCRL